MDRDLKANSSLWLLQTQKWISILVLCYHTNRSAKPTVLCDNFKPKMYLNLSAVIPNQQICEANSSLCQFQTQNGSQYKCCVTKPTDLWSQQFFVLISNPNWISILVLCYLTNRSVKPTVLCANFKPKLDLNPSAVLPNPQICVANSSLC